MRARKRLAHFLANVPPTTEVIRRHGPWRGLDDVEFATLEWVWWFNHHRLLSSIGHVPPVEYEETFRSHHTPQEGEMALT